MRQLMMGFLTAVAAILFATTANAASRWSCDGAEYVCGSSSRAASSSSYDDAEPKAARRAATQRTAKAVDSDDEKPARRQRVAKAVDNDDDKPARRKARNSDNDSGGDSYSGKASYYWQPQALASGGRFNPDGYTAAHKTLPFGTRVRVTNQNNGQSVDVVINDRGPYVAGRIIDLSRAAAHSINMQNSGVAPVSVRVLGRG